MTDTTQAAGLTDERQMFEQWLTDNRYDSGKYDANHLMAGVYHNHTTRLYWEAWRGRAALAAQAVPEGDDISLTFAVQHALNVLQDVHMYGGSDLGPSMWQQVANAIEFCERALAAAPAPAEAKEERTSRFGRVAITGPAEDVAFVVGHLPDVDDPQPQAAQPVPQSAAEALRNGKLVEAVARAICFADSGSTDDWEGATDLAQAAINVCNSRNPPRCSHCHSSTSQPPSQPQAAQPVAFGEIHQDAQGVRSLRTETAQKLYSVPAGTKLYTAAAPALKEEQIDKMLHELDDLALAHGDNLPGLALNSRGLPGYRAIVRAALRSTQGGE